MKPGRMTILFALAASATMTLGAFGGDEPKPVPQTLRAPTLRPADQDFLLQMRRSMGSEAPKWSAGTPEQQEQWFREGLEQAAHNTPAHSTPTQQPALGSPWPSGPADWGTAPQFSAGVQPPGPGDRGPAPRGPEPEPWRRLLGASQQLSHIAHDLDQQGFWAESDNVRAAAARLRERARRLAAPEAGGVSDPDPGPHAGHHSGHGGEEPH